MSIVRSKREVNEPIIRIISPGGDIRVLTRNNRPSKQAIRNLIAALRAEPKLLVTRLTEQMFDQAFIIGSAVAYCGWEGQSSHIKAFCALWQTNDPNFLELGTLWVSPEYRGTGVAKVIFGVCDDLVPQISQFLLTADPAIVAIAIKRGWRLEGNNWNGSGTFPWNTIIGPLWVRYPESPLKEPGLLLYRKARQEEVILYEANGTSRQKEPT